jgi:hypothetical protein
MIKVKAIYFLHTLLVVLFVISLFYSVIVFLDCYKIEQVKEYDLNAVYFSLSYCRDYRVLLFQLLPLVGIILRRPLGWIFLTSYFYFIQINIVINNQAETTLFSISLSLILLVLLFLLNTRTSILKYYNMLFKKSYLVNLISLLLGSFLSYLLILLKQ